MKVVNQICNYASGHTLSVDGFYKVLTWKQAIPMHSWLCLPNPAQQTLITSPDALHLSCLFQDSQSCKNTGVPTRESNILTPRLYLCGITGSLEETDVQVSRWVQPLDHSVLSGEWRPLNIGHQLWAQAAIPSYCLKFIQFRLVKDSNTMKRLRRFRSVTVNPRGWHLCICSPHDPQ